MNHGANVIKPAVDAAGVVDADNAPTARWKTAKPRFPTATTAFNSANRWDQF